jgi:hypothetical protein
VETDVRRRKPIGPRPLHHLERGDHGCTGLLEVEHHAVAQPLDGLAVVLRRGSLDVPRQLHGHLGGRFVAAFVGQPGTPAASAR